MGQTELILDLALVRLNHKPACGGKAVSLGLLRAAGLPSPDGFCVTTRAFASWLEQTDTSALDPSRFHDALKTVPVPAEVCEAVTLELRRRWDFPDSGMPVVVRSSATVEDDLAHSYAGVFSTYLGIVDTEAVMEKIRAVWISLFSRAATTYSRRFGLSHASMAMGVIVQRLAKPEASGVVFTADPLSNDREIFVVEATRGHPAPLVSGEITPDRFLVSKDSYSMVSAKHPFRETKLSWSTSSRSMIYFRLTPEEQMQSALVDHDVLRLCKLAARVEQLFGCPQDIEWALEDGRFLLLQARSLRLISYGSE